jgi:hypothetical protein
LQVLFHKNPVIGQIGHTVTSDEDFSQIFPLSASAAGPRDMMLKPHTGSDTGTNADYIAPTAGAA